MTINLTNDDGSVVVFLDPAGVQAAVDAAIATIPVSGTVEVTEVELKESDGSSETFVPEAPAA